MVSALCLAAAANAQTTTASIAEQPIRIEVGGYFLGYVLAGAQEEGRGKAGDNIRNYGIARESEIYFLGSTQLNNGLVVGVQVELEGETSADQIDETYIFFEHIRYGRAELGQTKSAPNKMWYGAPDPVPGFGFNSPIFTTVSPGANRAFPTTYISFGASGDEEKISAYTPQIYGLQFGLSFTPNGCEISTAAPAPCAGNSGLRPKRDIGQQSRIVEFALTYAGTAGEVGYGVYGGAGFAHLEVDTNPTSLRDQRQFGFGGQANYRGFTFGASYRWDNLGNSQGPDFNFFEPGGLAATNQQDFNAGLTYQTGPWVFGAQYHRTWVELTSDALVGSRAKNRKDLMDGFILGATYLLGPGIRLAGGMEYRSYRGVDRNQLTPENDAENDGVVFMFGTRIDF